MKRILYRGRRRWQKSVEWLRGFFHVSFTLRWYRLMRHPVHDISLFRHRIPFIERREYSQNGEDGILHAIFTLIGTTNRFFVEFGVEDGIECNTRFLAKHREWRGLLMDGSHENPLFNLHKEFITAENVELLFQKHSVPQAFDLLSIDIDGNDYWIWKAIVHFRPRVVVIEYNAHIPPPEAKTIPYDSSFQWDKTDYYGASLGALVLLGKQKGYTLIGTDRNGVNAFFVLNEYIPAPFDPLPWPQLFHPPAFKGKVGNRHPEDPLRRPWIHIAG